MEYEYLVFWCKYMKNNAEIAKKSIKSGMRAGNGRMRENPH